jgi:zinc/manganese transport system substrate-binding protein
MIIIIVDRGEEQPMDYGQRQISRLSGVFASVVALSLVGCQSTTPTNTAAIEEELQVVTTFLPITQFTKAVAGDRAEVMQLLPANIGTHDYQAKPEDAQKLAQADVLVQNGLEMEEFLDDLVKNASNANLKIIDSSQGVQVIATEEIATHNHDHDHGDKEHKHGANNPHIWLDPKRAIQQVENIRDGLIAADPDGKEIYTANAAGYIQKLRELDAETTKLLQPYAGKTFVAFHDFAPYFAQSYNLKANFLVDVPEENPSPQDVKRVTEEVKESQLKAILTEPQAGENAFASLAKDLNVKISTFNPIETGGPEAVDPNYYLQIMRENAQSLVNAFGGTNQSALPLWISQRVF